MANNTLLNEATSVGDLIATKDIGGVKHELVLLEFDDGAGGATQVSAADPLPVLASIDATGLATEAKQDTGNTSLATIAGAVNGTEMQVDVLSMPTVTVQSTNLDIRDLTFAADKVDATGSVLGAGTNNIGDVDVATLPTATSATLANVAYSATNVTLLASNSSRKMCTIFNDATVALYIKMGATASATSFTVKVLAGGYWEMPTIGYTGIIDGIWDAAGSGAARVTSY